MSFPLRCDAWWAEADGGAGLFYSSAGHSDAGDRSRAEPSRPLATDELEWLAQLRAGDAAGLEQIFHAYHAPLVRYVGRYASAEVAQDVVQEVMLRLWEGRARIIIRSSLRSYLFNSTRNLVLDRLAHESVESRHVQREEALHGEGTVVLRPDELLAAHDLEHAVNRAIATLPPRTREVFQLVRDGGLRYAEAAEVLGISINTVYVQMGRAQKLLLAALADWLR